MTFFNAAVHALRGPEFQYLPEGGYPVEARQWYSSHYDAFHRAADLMAQGEISSAQAREGLLTLAVGGAWTCLVPAQAHSLVSVARDLREIAESGVVTRPLHLRSSMRRLLAIQNWPPPNNIFRLHERWLDPCNRTLGGEVLPTDILTEFWGWLKSEWLSLHAHHVSRLEAPGMASVAAFYGWVDVGYLGEAAGVTSLRDDPVWMPYFRTIFGPSA